MKSTFTSLFILASVWLCQAQDVRKKGNNREREKSIETIETSKKTTEFWGKVIDSETGEALPSVKVEILNHSLGVVTDLEGKFQIKNIEPGEYTIKLSSIGFKTKEITGLKLKNGEIKIVPLSMEIEAIGVEEVVITSSLAQETEAAAQILQISSIRLIDVFSNELVLRSSSDLNMTSTLNRMPGVSLIDDKNLVIRGLNDKYIQFTINGLPWNGNFTDQNTIDLSAIPNQTLSQIRLYKTATSSDLPTFAGGNVDFVLPDIPEKTQTKVTLQYQYQSLAGFKPAKVYPGSGLFKSPKGLKDFPDEETFANLPYGSEAHRQATLNLPNRGMLYEEKNNYFNGRGMISYQYRKDLKNNQVIGFSTFMDIQSYNRLENKYIMIPYYYDTTLQKSLVNDSTLLHAYNQSQNIAGYINGGYQSQKFSVKMLNYINKTGKGIAATSDGNYLSDSASNTYTAYQYPSSSYTEIFNVHNQLLFKYLPSKAWEVRLKLFSNFDRSIKPFSANRTFYWDSSSSSFLLDPYDDAPYYIYANSITQSSWYKGLAPEVDYTFEKLGLKLMAGAFINQESRNFHARRVAFTPDSTGFSIDDAALLYQNEATLFSDENIGKGKFLADERLDDVNIQYSNSLNTAGFIRMNGVIKKKLFLDGGVRLESYVAEMFQSKQKYSIKKYNETFILPSFSARYQLFTKHNIRASWFSSIGRPTLKDRNPYAYFDQLYSFDWRGNPDLKTTQIQNFDLRWEFTPSARQLLSASVFYKQFKNPIEQYLSQTVVGVIAPYSLRNIPAGNVLGLEAEIRIIPEKIIPNFLFYTNASLFKSNNRADLDYKNGRALQGQTDYIVNVGGIYKIPAIDMEFALFFNRLGQQIVLVGTGPNDYPDIYQLPRNTLDIQVSKKFGKHTELRFTLNDILQSPYIRAQYYDGSKTYNKNSSLHTYDARLGFRAFLSFSYTL